MNTAAVKYDNTDNGMGFTVITDSILAGVRQYGYAYSGYFELLFETMAQQRVDEPWLININERLQFIKSAVLIGGIILFVIQMFLLRIAYILFPCTCRQFKIKLEINAMIKRCSYMPVMFESNCIQTYNRLMRHVIVQR